MSKVVTLGDQVHELLQGNMLILFSDAVPDELAEYCVLHQSKQSLDPMVDYHYLRIGEHVYNIIDFGEEAYQTWNELGHLTVRLASEAERLPGSIYVEGDCLLLPSIGDEIQFMR